MEAGYSFRCEPIQQALIDDDELSKCFKLCYNAFCETSNLLRIAKDVTSFAVCEGCHVVRRNFLAKDVMWFAKNTAKDVMWFAKKTARDITWFAKNTAKDVMWFALRTT